MVAPAELRTWFVQHGAELVDMHRELEPHEVLRALDAVRELMGYVAAGGR